MFWTIFEVFARPDLLTRVRDISQSAYVTRDQKSESVQLGNNPLLQSIFAETTRLRVAGIISRIPKGGDYQLGEWSIPEGSVLALSSCTGAMNKDIWNEGTAEEPHPLDSFWGERFLTYSNKPDSGPLRKKKITPTTENKQSATPVSTQEKPSDEPVFSLSGLNGAYLPFGGGAGSCPGRHFARQEVVSTLAILVRHFDIELRVRENWTPRMDTSFFPTGVLPPADKVPFRIRRRQLSE